MGCAEQKVAIVTGASRGIGAGLVEAYRKHDYRVIANSRAIEESPHPEVVSVAGDIADPRTAERIIDEALARFGRIDTLINNAGVFIPKPFTLYTYDDYARVTSVNTAGFFGITQQVVAQLLAQGAGGHVITIAATLAEQAHTAVPSALTALTKGGLIAATKSLAIEYAANGIRFNAISPGVVDTPMHSGVDAVTAYAAMHPQHRIGTVSDIVHGALYLEMASFVTGEILHIDGGQSAGH
ncbi:3-oxoacyl-ACP reductase [Mycobacterium triplex]|uniref:3-oxoacyl-ACP reductase n=1 Tax=Mycobacterium triplex TaxID=47839 RepID=A0A024JU58_9MYCO|nr:SDR family oxidoreductase [Mycobacterium triplex]ORX02937.1 3-oxoacyl-ACP reductase [Mycobacterium triplex]CDO87365.1 dehydrogenase [Mycobacterium triplex]